MWNETYCPYGQRVPREGLKLEMRMRSVLLATDTGTVPATQFRCVVENQLKRKAQRFLEDAGYIIVHVIDKVPTVIPRGELVRTMEDLSCLVTRPKKTPLANQMWGLGTVDCGDDGYYTYPTTAKAAVAAGLFYFYSSGILWQLYEDGYELMLHIRDGGPDQDPHAEVKGGDSLETLIERCSVWKYREYPDSLDGWYEEKP